MTDVKKGKQQPKVPEALSLMWLSMAGILLALVAFVIKLYMYGPMTGFNEPKQFNFGGTVLVTDATGVGREVCHELARQGIHVLAGVPTEQDKSLFLFDTNKGIEPIVFNLEEPQDIVTVLYRTRELIQQLDRPLTGIVLNTLYMDAAGGGGAMSVTRRKVMDSHLKQPVFVGGLDIHFDLSLTEYDRATRALVRGFVRLIDATVQMWREPTIHPGRLVLLAPAHHHLWDSHGATAARGRGSRLEVVASSTLKGYLAQVPASLARQGLDVSLVTVLAPVVGAAMDEATDHEPAWALGAAGMEGVSDRDGGGHSCSDDRSRQRTAIADAVSTAFTQFTSAPSSTLTTITAGCYTGIAIVDVGLGHRYTLQAPPLCVPVSWLLLWHRASDIFPFLTRLVAFQVPADDDGFEESSDRSKGSSGKKAVISFQLGPYGML